MPHKRAKRSVREAAQKERGQGRAILMNSGFNNAPTASSLANDTPRNATRILNSWATQQSFRSRGGVSSEDTGDRPRKKAKPSPSAPTASGSASTPSSSTAHAGPSSTAGSHKGLGGSGGVAKKDKGKGKGKESGSNGTIAPIQPHETLGDYNRRVEDALRGGVAKAIKSAAAIKAEHARAAKAAKEERKRKAQGLPPLDGAAAGSDGDEGESGKATNTKGKRKASADGDYLEPEDRPVVTFKPAPGPRRLNDVAQAPPSLPKLKGMGKLQGGAGAGAGAAAGGADKKGTIGSGRTDVLNVGQKRLLEEERERVIKQYRDIKAAREKAKPVGQD